MGSSELAEATLILIGGSACIGIGMKLITLLDKAVVLPFFPNVFDGLTLVVTGVWLCYEGYRRGR